MAAPVSSLLGIDQTKDRSATSARDHAAAIPWLATSVVMAATAVVVGVVWDISWHMTIGRDTFWTPAHLAIYFGGMIGGGASGVVVLQTTFGRSVTWKESSVRLWGFRGPLGAWVSIWGAFAMLTSAPFDDWWHNAYGLDVKILSPPHMVLAAGMVALALGAMLVMLAAQNRAEGEISRRWALLFAWTAGCVLSFFALMVTEYSFRTMMHRSLFYQVSSAVFPLLLVAAGNVTRHRWGATLVAGSYMLIRMLMVWILPLFPAEPKLGPIYQDITHMVPMDFPLLLIVPAVAMDLVRHRMAAAGFWRLVLLQGAAFWAVFLAVQWPFASFLVSPASHNWLFATDNYPYDIPMTSNYVRGIFMREPGGTAGLLMGLAIALPLALVSAAIGGLWSKWLRQVRR